MIRVQKLKAPMRAWLKKYDDQRLADLLAHAQSGKLEFASCCCFIGSLNAPHALKGLDFDFSNGWSHLDDVRSLDGAKEAEQAFYKFTSRLPGGDGKIGCAYGCRIVVALCKSEFKQREWARRRWEGVEEVLGEIDAARMEEVLV